MTSLSDGFAGSSKHYFYNLFAEKVRQPEILEPARYKLTVDLLRPGRLKEQAKKQVIISTIIRTCA